MKKMILAATAALLVFGAGVMVGANRFGKPKSVLHVVTLAFKAESTPAQRDLAIKGVEKMAGEIPGVKNVWIDAIRVQGPFCPAAGATPASPDFTHAFVMEFENEAAHKAYADHAAHKDWEKVYLPVRAESRTHQITNK